MHYFAYCTWLDPDEVKRFMPTAAPVTKGRLANHTLAFHAAAERSDRGWCHLSNTAAAWGRTVLGVVFRNDPEHFDEDYDDFERCCVTVYGDDGRLYDCWTYRLVTPGIAMRPPDFYWGHIPKGMRHWGFPQSYIDEVQATFAAAAPCPRPDRPNPSAVPGRGADTR